MSASKRVETKCLIFRCVHMTKCPAAYSAYSINICYKSRKKRRRSAIKPYLCRSLAYPSFLQDAGIGGECVFF